MRADELDLDVALAASSSRSPALASGGLAVVRPLAARASAFSGGRNNLADLVTGRVLVWLDGPRRINLLTTIRHRRADMLGPWARPPGGWQRETPLAGTELYTADFTDDGWAAALGDMRAGRLTALDQTIEYDLDRVPTVHYAWRDQTIGSGASLASPFNAHSAEISEYWATGDSPRKRWLELREHFPEASLHRLGVPLDRFIDRAGNVLVFAAFDTLTCAVNYGGDASVRFTARANEPLIPGTYRAAVWAAQGEDLVLHREFPVTAGDTHCEVDADIDRIGFALYRDTDGQCVDLFDVHLMRGVSTRMTLLGPEIVLQSRHKKELGRAHMSTSTMSTVTAEERSAVFGRIRQRRLERCTDVHETTARRQKQLFRFVPGQFAEAVEQMASFIAEPSEDRASIYLADRYFLDTLKGDPAAKLRGYIRLVSAASGRPLRILCTRVDPTPPDWWVQLPPGIRGQTEIRAVLQRVPGRPELLQPAFHDRFLITPQREVLFTNSINGWNAHGVTFATCPFGVYQADAERMWNLPIGEHDGVCVHKLSP